MSRRGPSGYITQLMAPPRLGDNGLMSQVTLRKARIDVTDMTADAPFRLTD